MKRLSILSLIIGLFFISCGDSLVKVSTDNNIAYNPSLAWNEKNGEFGITWHESRNGRYDIYFAILDRDGNKKFKETLVTDTKRNTGASKHPQLCYTGAEYGLTWQDYRDGSWEIYFCRVDEKGKKLMNEKRITNKGKNTKSSLYPSIVHTGSEYALAWEDYRNTNSDDECQIFFVRLDSSGGKVIENGEVQVVNARPVHDNPSLIYDSANREFAIAWQGSEPGGRNKVIKFARLESNGRLIDRPAKTIAADQRDTYYPSLVYTGANYAVAWHDDRDQSSKIYFKIIEKKEDISTPFSSIKRKKFRLESKQEVKITNNAGGAVFTNLVWTGKVYGLTWLDNRDGWAKVHFTKILPSGTAPDPKDEIIISPNRKAKLNSKKLNKPSLVYAKGLSSFFVSWADDRTGHMKVYFEKVKASEK